MPHETDFAWLAGIIDGEGSVALTWTGKCKHPGVRVVIYGSDMALMGKVRSILKAAEIPISFSLDNRTSRPCGKVSLASYSSVKLFPLVAPYLVRQIDRFRAGVEFLSPRYASSSPNHYAWTPADHGAWNTIRGTFGLRAVS